MSADAEKSARESMEKSRMEVMECEEEIKSIKNALKSLTMEAAGGSSSLNHLEVSILKVKAAEGGSEGDADDESSNTFKVHLSSPIEDRTITKLHDPLNPTAEESLAKFESVETSNALLTVEVFSTDGSRKLGVSAPHDLLPLKGGEKKTSTLDIAIIAEKGIDEVVEKLADKESGDANADDAPETAADDGEEEVNANESESWEDAVEEEDKGEGEKDVDTEEDKTEEEGEKEAEKTEEEEATKAEESETKEAEAEEPAQDESKSAELQLPIYTLTIQMEYTPSTDDKRDALYDKLNEVSKRKVAAINELRKSAGIVNRAKAAEAASSGSSDVSGKKPAVKPGFLNKSKAAEEKLPPFWKRWYEKTIGPKSMLWVVGPIAKNYVIFAGISLFIHYKGDLLALPPPV